jgi:hypothetical protein
VAAAKCEAVLLPFVGDVLARLDVNQQEAYAERAAIIEHDAGQPIALAECMAVVETLKRWPSLLTGLVALEIELNGETRWLLTSDIAFAHRHLANVGAHPIAVCSLIDIVNAQYGGVAVLAKLA